MKIYVYMCVCIMYSEHTQLGVATSVGVGGLKSRVKLLQKGVDENWRGYLMSCNMKVNICSCRDGGGR